MQGNSRKIKHQGMFICKAGDMDPMAISCYNVLISALLNGHGSTGPILAGFFYAARSQVYFIAYFIYTKEYLSTKIKKCQFRLDSESAVNSACAYDLL